VAGSPGELARSLADTCATWETVALSAIENAPVASDVPALVLAGRFDPITPPSYGRMAAETLARSHFFEFPAAGHGVLDANCPMEMVAAFLDDPVSPPDLGCHSEGSIEFLVQ
jgi:pimeloyl-ACP methyl ester carboxylesterase